MRLKLFFMDLNSVPKNHLRYISWIAYIVRKDCKSSVRESKIVENAPHSNYYLQDGTDMGALMDTDIPVREVSAATTASHFNPLHSMHSHRLSWRCGRVMLMSILSIIRGMLLLERLSSFIY